MFCSRQKWYPILQSQSPCRILLGVGVLMCFYIISLYNYLLFHSLVELFSFMVGCAVFMLFWNSRRFLDNGFFLFIGIACLFGGIFDLMHVLTYQGMSVFPGTNGDESIQLKTAGRWIVGLSFLAAPLFLHHRLKAPAALIAYTSVLVVVFCLVFANYLPDFYTQKQGMTSFQHVTRGISCTFFLAVAGLLVVRRKDFDPHVLRLLLVSMIASSASEFASAVSVDFRGLVKVLAHLSELLSLYLIYKAFIEVGLTKPLHLFLTSLQKSEEALQRQQQFLEAVLDSIQTGIVACDAGGTLTLFNSATIAFHGLPQEPIPSEQWAEHYDLFLPDGKTRMQKEDIPLFRALQGEEVHDVEMMIIPKNGVPRTLLSSGRPLFDNQCRRTGAVAAMLDITERKQAELEIKDYALALESANRELQNLYNTAQAATRAKSDFLANMSHEIRTPMTAILGFADILAGNLAESGRSENLEAANTIKKNGEHLLTILNDILDLSKIEAGKFDIQRVPCSPCQLLEEVASLMRVRAQTKGLTLSVEHCGPVPETILTDPLRLRQILVNLLGNAVKFTETGSIRMVVSLISPSGPEAMLKIDVIDTGVGISTEQLAHIFQPFTQGDTSTHRKFGGTGLGLAISRRLATILGGDLVAASVPSKGSTFTLTVAAGKLSGIRMLTQPFEVIAQSCQMPQSTLAQQIKLSCRILLVEDGPDNQRLLSFLLSKAGAEVVIVDNGPAAVEHALAIHPDCNHWSDAPDKLYDVILMDIQMPGMDGYEATRRIRAAGYSGPIIALTAYAMVEDRKKCIDAGCDEYLIKPIDRNILFATVAKYSAWRTKTSASPSVDSCGQPTSK